MFYYQAKIEQCSLGVDIKFLGGNIDWEMTIGGVMFLRENACFSYDHPLSVLSSMCQLNKKNYKTGTSKVVAISDSQKT